MSHETLTSQNGWQMEQINHGESMNYTPELDGDVVEDVFGIFIEEVPTEDEEGGRRLTHTATARFSQAELSLSDTAPRAGHKGEVVTQGGRGWTVVTATPISGGLIEFEVIWSDRREASAPGFRSPGDIL